MTRRLLQHFLQKYTIIKEKYLHLNSLVYFICYV